MAWIESHEDLSLHPKIKDVMRSLEISLPTAIGILHLLWHFGIKFSWDSGDLSKYTSIHLSEFMQWQGDPDKLIATLQNCGWLDGMKIHDWDEYTMHYKLMMEKKERQKEQVRNRVKDFRLRNANKNVTKTLRNAYVTQCNAPTLPNHTVPNHTLPNHIRNAIIDFENMQIHDKAVVIGKKTKDFMPPTQDDCTKFFKEKNSTDLQAIKYYDYYSSVGWKVGGRAAMKDWQAAARRWIRTSQESNSQYEQSMNQNEKIKNLMERAKAK